jgi:hypothetical protein
MPLDPGVYAPPEEKFPRVNDIFSLKARDICLYMGATKNEEEERRRTVKWIARADQPVVPLESRLKGSREGKVALLDPDTAIDDALALEAAKLKRDVRQELHHHVRTCSDACKVFEVLAHEAVA